MDVSDSQSEGDDSSHLGDDEINTDQLPTTVPPHRSASPLVSHLPVQDEADAIAAPISAKPLAPAAVGGGLKRNADGTVIGPKFVPRRQKPTREVRARLQYNQPYLNTH